MQPGGVSDFIDGQIARADLAGHRRGGAADGDAQSRVNLAWARRVQDNVVSAPFGGYRGPAPLGDDGQHWHVKAYGAQLPQELPDLHQVTPCVH